MLCTRPLAFNCCIMLRFVALFFSSERVHSGVWNKMTYMRYLTVAPTRCRQTMFLHQFNYLK